MDDSTWSLQSNYHQIQLIQTTHWLVINHTKYISNVAWTTRAASAVTIFFLRSYILKSLALFSLSVCNLRCCLDVYWSYNALTLCRRYSWLGYPTSRFNNLLSYCPCGADHNFSNNACIVDGCQGFAWCTYLQVKCTNCNNTLYASSNSASPTSVRTREHAGCFVVPIETEEAPLQGQPTMRY